VHAFDLLGDPVRRRILELLTDGERAAGDVGAVVQQEFGITQPAVSQQLKALRDNGFVTVRAVGNRRLYAIDPEPFHEVNDWLAHFRRLWSPQLDALATELARGRRDRRRDAEQMMSPDEQAAESQPAHPPSPPDRAAVAELAPARQLPGRARKGKAA
jgi:DNA-binding transcriptional ArsR family regulator